MFIYLLFPFISLFFFFFTFFTLHLFIIFIIFNNLTYLFPYKILFLSNSIILSLLFLLSLMVYYLLLHHLFFYSFIKDLFIYSIYRIIILFINFFNVRRNSRNNIHIYNCYFLIIFQIKCTQANINHGTIHIHHVHYTFY